MVQMEERRRLALSLLATGFLILTGSQALAGAGVERTTLNVVVKEAETGDPINQARLTLQFSEPRGVFKRSKKISYSAKTNMQGRCRFTHIPKGTILLMVTAEHRQSFGKEFELEKDNQVIEVKLRKPQPLL
jgi:hypothetical protein